MCIVICTLLLSCPARGAWVEMLIGVVEQLKGMSCPARGAWVEILVNLRPCAAVVVVPRKGRVG